MAEEYASLTPTERVYWLAQRGCDARGYRHDSRPQVAASTRIQTLPTRPVPQASTRQGAQAVRVTTVTDEFTGDVTHRLEIEFGRFESMTVFSRTRERMVAVMIHALNRSWRYLECHHVAALADQHRIIPSDTDHDGRVMRGGVSEHVTFTVSIEDLRALAHARRIRFRVCNTVYELPASAGAAFAELYRRTVPDGHGPAEAAPADSAEENAPAEK